MDRYSILSWSETSSAVWHNETDDISLTIEQHPGPPLFVFRLRFPPPLRGLVERLGLGWLVEYAIDATDAEGLAAVLRQQLALLEQAPGVFK